MKLIAIILLFTSTLGFSQSSSDSLLKIFHTKDVFYPEVIKADILKRINDNRIKMGLGTLTLRDDLSKYSQNHSNRMILTKSYEHSGTTCDCTGEVINGYEVKIYSHHSVDSRATVGAWTHSEPHADIIYKQEAKYCGIGISDGYWNGMLVTYFVLVTDN